jgi:hypothetical protein
MTSRQHKQLIGNYVKFPKYAVKNFIDHDYEIYSHKVISLVSHDLSLCGVRCVQERQIWLGKRVNRRRTILCESLRAEVLNPLASLEVVLQCWNHQNETLKSSIQSRRLV